MGIEPTRPFGQEILSLPRITNSATRPWSGSYQESRRFKRRDVPKDVPRGVSDAAEDFANGLDPGDVFVDVIGHAEHAELDGAVAADADEVPAVAEVVGESLFLGDRVEVLGGVVERGLPVGCHHLVQPDALALGVVAEDGEPVEVRDEGVVNGERLVGRRASHVEVRPGDAAGCREHGPREGLGDRGVSRVVGVDIERHVGGCDLDGRKVEAEGLGDAPAADQALLKRGPDVGQLKVGIGAVLDLAGGELVRPGRIVDLGEEVRRAGDVVGFGGPADPHPRLVLVTSVPFLRQEELTLHAQVAAKGGVVGDAGKKENVLREGGHVMLRKSERRLNLWRGFFQGLGESPGFVEQLSRAAGNLGKRHAEGFGDVTLGDALGEHGHDSPTQRRVAVLGRSQQVAQKLPEQRLARSDGLEDGNEVVHEPLDLVGCELGVVHRERSRPVYRCIETL